MILWRADHPGILIDPRGFAQVGDDAVVHELDPAQSAVFVSATRRALDRIASRPVGRDLLSLISRRCQRPGAVGPMTCRILMGAGTLSDKLGAKRPNKHYAREAARNTFTIPGIPTTPADAFLAQARRMKRVARRTCTSSPPIQ